MAKEREPKSFQDNEIDLVELIKSIWYERKFIAKVISVFLLIGLVYAFTSPIEYQASSKLLPESQTTQGPNLGNLAGLAGLAGVDLGVIGESHAGTLSPQLYPEIVNSLPFILAVLNDTVYFEQLNLYTTPFHYFKEIEKASLIGLVKKYTLGLPALFMKNLKGESKVSEKITPFYRLSKEDWLLIEKFKDRILIEINPETGIIELRTEIPDPYAAAQIAKKVELMITKAVVEYQTNKSQKNLEFILETYQEAKTEFELIQLKLAQTVDRNKNVTTATAKIELQRIEQEYEVAFNIYKGLSSQVEQAKIKLKEETPVFTVLEPVRIPEDKHKPKRKLIVILFLLAGFLVSTGYLFVKHVIKLMT